MFVSIKGSAYTHFRAALDAFENLPGRPDLARRTLAAVCTRHGLPQAAAILGDA